MKSLSELLEDLSVADKKIYCREIASWDNRKKSQLEKLANALSVVGAKNPISWAYSEIVEGVPQIGRFLLLKNLYSIIQDPYGIIAEAAEIDDDIPEAMSNVTALLGEGVCHKILYAYGRAIISGVISFLDEGNYGAQSDGISWHLCETDAAGKPTGRIIKKLHEDFYDFEE